MQAAGSSEEESPATATLLSTFDLLRAEECLALNVGEVTFEARHEVDVVRLSIRGSKTDRKRVNARSSSGNRLRDCDTRQRKGDRLEYKEYLDGMRDVVRRHTGIRDWSAVGTHSMRRTGAQWMWAEDTLIQQARVRKMGRDGPAVRTSSLEKDYLDGVARSQEYRYAYAMLSGVYDGA
ncbi:hypothetical protein FOL46_007140 [Perkinsus olseni]|nr:hypothetical protein FOL46_007140 [Perkinsus olseni]